MKKLLLFLVFFFLFTPHTLAFATSYGVAVDITDTDKIPTNGDLVYSLGTQWVRYVWTGSNIQDARTIFQNANQKQLVVINNQTVPGAPLGNSTLSVWQTYVDSQYVPQLKQIIQNNNNISAIEVWNEEDSGSSLIDANIYAYLIKQAAQAIKAVSPNIQVVMGGLASGHSSYISDVLSADPTALNQVDAIGLHPYGRTPAGWTPPVSGFSSNPDLGGLVNEYQEQSTKPIWVTEIGWGTTLTADQATYLTDSFNVLNAQNIPVVIWYAFNDYTGGNNQSQGWGLIDKSDTIKPSGTAFANFTHPPAEPALAGQSITLATGETTNSTVTSPCVVTNIGTTITPATLPPGCSSTQVSSNSLVQAALALKAAFDACDGGTAGNGCSTNPNFTQSLASSSFSQNASAMTTVFPETEDSDCVECLGFVRDVVVLATGKDANSTIENGSTVADFLGLSNPTQIINTDGPTVNTASGLTFIRVTTPQPGDLALTKISPEASDPSEGHIVIVENIELLNNQPDGFFSAIESNYNPCDVTDENSIISGSTTGAKIKHLTSDFIFYRIQ